MSDETITQADGPCDATRLLDALAASEKRLAEVEVELRREQNERGLLEVEIEVSEEQRKAAEREADRLRHGVAIEGDIVCSARRELDRLQPLVDAARALAVAAPGSLDEDEAEQALCSAALALFSEEVRRG